MKQCELDATGHDLASLVSNLLSASKFKSYKGTFSWDYSGIGIHGIDDIHVILRPIPFSE